MGKFEVFKNAVEIPRDQLLRHLIYLPVQVATELDRRCAQVRGHGTSSMKTPLIRLLECHISKQDGLEEAMLTGKVQEPSFIKPLNLMRSETCYQQKNGIVDEAWPESGIESISQQEKKECNLKSPVEHGSVLSRFKSLASDGNVLSTEATIQSTSLDSQHAVIVSKASSESRSKECLSDCYSKQGIEMELKQGVNGRTDESKKRKRDFDLQVNFKKNSSAEYISLERTPSPVVTMDIEEQTKFLTSAIRMLRNSKPNQSKELFDILSASSLPIKKEHLVEQLIWMAKENNKKTLVEELLNYQHHDAAVAK